MPPTVSLVFPRTDYQTGDPPLGLAYVAAALRVARPDLDVRIVDGTFLGSESKLVRAVAESRPSAVGVFVDTLTLPPALAIARAAREWGAATIAGGPLASVAPETLSDEFDVVMLGEGEPRIADVVERALAGEPFEDIPGLMLQPSGAEPYVTIGEPPRPALDELPFPAWDLLDMERYTGLWPYLDSVRLGIRGTNVVGSRGCLWRCTYCQPTLNATFGPRVRHRSPASIVAEVQELQGRYGIEGVFFHDDTLTAKRVWLLELCEALAGMPRPILWGCNSRLDVLREELIGPMVAAGMRSVHIGIEAGSQRVREEVLEKNVDEAHLDRILKTLEQHGAHALGFFMLGSPTETLGEMLSTISMAVRLPLTEATFSLTSVLPGTRLFERVAADPRFTILEGEGPDYYNRRNFVDHDAPMTARTLRALQLAGLGAFYLHPRRLRYLARHLRSGEGLRKLAMKSARFLRLR